MEDISYGLVVGLIVGIVTAWGSLFIKELKFEPLKWKKDKKHQELSLKLNIYGDLLTLLETGRYRAKRQQISDRESQPHVLFYPEDLSKLKEIFGKYRYFISNKLLDDYFENIIQKDEFFMDLNGDEIKIDGTIDSSSKSHSINLKQKQTKVICCDLTTIESIAKSDYEDIQIEYKKINE